MQFCVFIHEAIGLILHPHHFFITIVSYGLQSVFPRKEKHQKQMGTVVSFWSFMGWKVFGIGGVMNAVSGLLTIELNGLLTAKWCSYWRLLRVVKQQNVFPCGFWHFHHISTSGDYLYSQTTALLFNSFVFNLNCQQNLHTTILTHWSYYFAKYLDAEEAIDRENFACISFVNQLQLPYARHYQNHPQALSTLNRLHNRHLCPLCWRQYKDSGCTHE